LFRLVSFANSLGSVGCYVRGLDSSCEYGMHGYDGGFRVILRGSFRWDWSCSIFLSLDIQWYSPRCKVLSVGWDNVATYFTLKSHISTRWITYLRRWKIRLEIFRVWSTRLSLQSLVLPLNSLMIVLYFLANVGYYAVPPIEIFTFSQTIAMVILIYLVLTQGFWSGYDWILTGSDKKYPDKVDFTHKLLNFEQ
jgi:hypothetical protein